MSLPDQPSTDLDALGPFALLAPLGPDAAERGLRWAVAQGIDATGQDSATERSQSAHHLLCSSIDLLLDVALSAERMEAYGRLLGDAALDETDRVAPLLDGAARAAQHAAAGALRLVWRALEVHARDVGYLRQPWHDEATSWTQAIVDPTIGVPGLPANPGAAEAARAAANRVIAALEALPVDRMAVPGELAAAIGLLDALFLLACELRLR
ncbi:hypothetical protein PAI11_18530 [Patulibacter medicamentivorans]|jgi:hypothetical protein|uniref:Uncharacterized protein n=1 Tax=Patulibacter medicamentivorans TaxID=1097667 RepID=H0E4W8_9ACTN|nr:hypothetical protein [Patulibacter medicamentivorans]EHN11263.1 hypothetical protein PAI11_18530 [Patulibacter medicamentivorans]